MFFQSSDGKKETCACLAAAQCGAGSVCTYDCSCAFPCQDAAAQVSATLQSMGELTFAGTFEFLDNSTDSSVACSIKWDPEKLYLVGFTIRWVSTLCHGRLFRTLICMHAHTLTSPSHTRTHTHTHTTATLTLTLRFLPCHQSDWFVGGLWNKPTIKCRHDRKFKDGSCQDYPHRASQINYLFKTWTCNIEGIYSCSPLKFGDTFAQNYVVDASSSRFSPLNAVCVIAASLLLAHAPIFTP